MSLSEIKNDVDALSPEELAELAAFIRQRDRIYALITAAVLCLLLLSLVLGRVE